MADRISVSWRPAMLCGTARHRRICTLSVLLAEITVTTGIWDTPKKVFDNRRRISNE